jgi:hypothetical protein
LRPQLFPLDHLGRPFLNSRSTKGVEALELIFRQLEALPRPHDCLDILSRHIGRAHHRQHDHGD